MSLLTKEERQTLSKPERQALRKVRRAERKAEREPPKWLKWDVLEPLARGLILEAAALALPGRDKMDEVIDELTRKWDRIIRWDWLATAGPAGAIIAPLLEAADGIALDAAANYLLRPHVQRLYDEMEAEGLL